jgi:hypothetical protein
MPPNNRCKPQASPRCCGHPDAAAARVEAASATTTESAPARSYSGAKKKITTVNSGPPARGRVTKNGNVSV